MTGLSGKFVKFMKDLVGLWKLTSLPSFMSEIIFDPLMAKMCKFFVSVG